MSEAGLSFETATRRTGGSFAGESLAEAVWMRDVTEARFETSVAVLVGDGGIIVVSGDDIASINPGVRFGRREVGAVGMRGSAALCL